MEELMLTTMRDQEDLPPGITMQCSCCGTRLRRGQPHSAVEPVPHYTYEMLCVSPGPDFQPEAP